MEFLQTLCYGGMLLLLPGYATLVVLGASRRYGFARMLAVASGLSIAVVPILLYAATNLGIRVTRAVILGLLTLCGILTLWDTERRLRRADDALFCSVSPVTILIGVVVVVTVLSRLTMVRDISFPLWTDSYHHTVISKLIADLGAIPDSYRPYDPIDQYTYHFGFHVLAAWFSVLSGVPIWRSVVLVGQLVNAMAVPTACVLATHVLERRSGMLAVAYIVGFLSHMPAFFVNWGRYTQLTGQVLLPVAMVLTIESLESERLDLRRVALAGLVAAGLFLVHIRIFLFYVIFAVVLFVTSQWRRRESQQAMLTTWASGLVIGLTCAVILIPWGIRFLDGFGSVVLADVAQGYQEELQQSYFDWDWRYLTEFGLRGNLLVLAVLGGGLAIVDRHARAILLMVWMACVYVMANVYRLGMTPLFTNLIVSKCLYLPGAILIGYLCERLWGWIWPVFEIRLQSHRRAVYAAFALVLSSLLVSGSSYTVGLILPENGFVRPADLEAMRWIREHVPEDNTLFYVSAHFWTPQVAHGLDAGYWIPLLAERQTILPMETYGSDGDADYQAFVNRRIRALQDAEDSTALWQTMRDYAVTYVYIGRRETLLKEYVFLQDPGHFRRVYAKDGVWIFQVL